MKTKDYAIYAQPRDGNWLRAEIVGETPAGLQAGLAWYLLRLAVSETAHCATGSSAGQGRPAVRRNEEQGLVQGRTGPIQIMISSAGSLRL